MEEFETLATIETKRRAAEEALSKAKAKLDLYAIELGIESLEREIERLKGIELLVRT